MAGDEDIAAWLCASHPKPAIQLEMDVLQRTVEDASIRWINSSNGWPILLSHSGEENFEFSPFSACLVAAMYNVLCVADSLRRRQPLDVQPQVQEFLAKAAQLRIHRG